MEKNQASNIIIDSNQTVLCTEIFQQEPQRFTPTGKISHAKTRVYTQRYRKEWEQMPDFKGWLTSVPNQSTRAFCAYCKKNLHAHRLSLLKHTCTMKHQRAALMYQTQVELKRGDDGRIINFDQQFETVDVDVLKKSDNDGDDDDDDDDDDGDDIIDHDDNELEYVVERLDMDDDESRKKLHDSSLDDHDNDIQLKLESTDDLHYNKRVKLTLPDQRDALAQAMAHVHGEYSDSNNDEQTNNELQDNTEFETLVKNEKNTEILADNKITDISGGQSTTVSDQAGTLTITSIQNKTIVLSSGKTVTLTTGKLPPGYVLSKVKGNMPSLILSGSKPTATATTVRPIAPKQNVQTIATSTASVSSSVPSTSNQNKKMSIGVKNLPHKTSCISTHVLDTSKGLPVGGLQVSLYKLMDGRWTFLNESTTSPNGRCNDLVDMNKTQFTAGRYKLHFDVDKYFSLRRIETMFPFIEIVFDVKNPTGNHHIPILLTPFGYTTYRGTDR